jgi:LL-diaminopimelate aminotransferase
MGWVCGNDKLLAAYRHIKENSDSGQFFPIQVGAAAALDDDAFCQKSMARLRARAEKVISVLGDQGFQCPRNGHPFYLYAAVPSNNGWGGADESARTAEEAFERLLIHRGILTVPWDEAGTYLRFAMTISVDPDNLARALEARFSVPADPSIPISGEWPG